MTLRTNPVIIAIFCVPVILGLGWFGVMAPYSSISSLRNQRTEARVAEAIIKQQVDNLSTSQSLYDSLLSIESATAESFWKRTDQLAFLTALEGLAAKAGVGSAVSLSEIPPGSDPIEVPITLTIDGSWAGLIAELKSLEQLKPLVLIDTISLQAASSGTIHGIFTAKTLWR